MKSQGIVHGDEAREAVEHLRAMLRIDSSNPPGKEGRVAAYLAGVLDREGIAYEMVEAVPGRGRAMLVARLSADGGRPEDGLLLSAHMDVVPARPEVWTHHPFRGVEADGYVWGRGAVDMKHMLAQSLMVMVVAKRRGWRLKRDLAFAAVADEEEGCEKGSLWLARNRPDLIRARWGLTEVGGFTLDVGGRTLVPVGVATKGFAWVRAIDGENARGGRPPHRDRFKTAILGLADDPHPPGCANMGGFQSFYRTRVGSHRMLYAVRELVLVVTVVKVGHRRDVYR